MITGLASIKAASERHMNLTWEYALVVVPDEAVQTQLNTEKNYFFTAYGLEASQQSTLHITVTNFSAREEMESTLMRWIQRVCNNHPRFVTTLNNFSGLPSHTVYLRIQNHQPFKELVDRLKAIGDFIQSNDCPPIRLVSTPYITIANGLHHEIYEKAIKDYSGRLFHASFSVNSLLLMKRKHSSEVFQQVSFFPLAAQPNNLFN